jgi:hypothetical protein
LQFSDLHEILMKAIGDGAVVPVLMPAVSVSLHLVTDGLQKLPRSINGEPPPWRAGHRPGRGYNRCGERIVNVSASQCYEAWLRQKRSSPSFWLSQ